ncbi:MAG: LuxR C-terminal-related transcriptional regulator [Chloroflexota bacterium]
MPSPVARPHSNLPAELTSLVGRRDELGAIKRQLGTARLLTLTGPGGVGKTRLALRTARDLASHFADGARFVRLAEVSDPADVSSAVAATLGLQDRSAPWTISVLAEHLSEKRSLLVLDNCEHVLDGAAVLAGTLLRGCPELQILATSRQALGVAGEVVEQVQPMSMPDPADRSTGEAWRSDAVSLFVERAAARGRGFALDSNSAPAVLALCRQLDGLPLALELAAVRLDSLGIEALSEGLRTKMEMLGSGDPSHLPHQRTMEATIDWSYQLLTPEEKLLFARLSIFAGGFEIDAAQQVCGDESLTGSAVAAVIGALVEKSLVHRSQKGGRERFRMLEILRQSSRQHLTVDDARVLRRRHLGWMADVAAIAGAHDEREVEIFARLRAERANLWAALEFSLEDDDAAQTGVAICRDLFEYWLTEGDFSKLQNALASFLEAIPDPTRARADALWVSSIIRASLSDAEHALAEADEAVRIGRLVGDPVPVAFGLTALAAAHWVGGEQDQAILRADEAMSLGRLMGLDFAVLAAMDVKGIAQVFGGDLEGGIATGYQTIALSEQLGEKAVRAYALHFLSIAALREDRLDEAVRLARLGLEIRQELGDVTGIAHLAEVLAFAAGAMGDHVRATTLLGGAEGIWEAAAGKEYQPLLADQAGAMKAGREALGEAKYLETFEVGRAMERDDVIAYALGSAPPRRRVITPPTQSQGGLSRREMEVARLMADGASNAATASQLFISERTVESHVTNIFNKLGVDSRAQVVRWVTSLAGADA